MQGSNLKKFITIQQLDGNEHQLTEVDLPIIIGTEKTSHIALPEGSPMVAFIGAEQGHLFIQPSNTITDPLFHNDRRLTGSSWLKSNDIVQYQKTIITCHISGDKVSLVVTEIANPKKNHGLQPPLEPPPTSTNTSNGFDIPVTITDKPVFSTRKKVVTTLVALTFLVLGLGVLFVLLARPLEIKITPEPDSLSISGFPPAIKFGSDYLCIPGTYSVKIEKQGYSPYTESLSINRTGNNSLAVALSKLPGKIELITIPSDGIRVFSDNHLIGVTPPNSITISPGKHAIRLEKERYKPFNTEILIEGKNKTQTIKAELQPDWAEITFNSTPPQASVFVDGILLGKTPLTAELTSGHKDVALTKELYSEYNTTLRVQAGNSESHSFQMQLLPGQLSITTTPKQAAVTVDNNYLGATPLTFPLTSNSEHELSLHAPGFKVSTRSITLAPGEKKAIDLKLVQQQGVIYLATHPPDASVTINGKHFSNSQGKLVLPAKQLTLEVKAPGYKPVSQTILPKVGFSQQLTIDLTPETETAISYSPAKAGQSLQTSAGQKMIRVKPSSFQMGAPRREPGRRANERERTVIMERIFYLSEKLVTNREYRLFKPDHSSGIFSGHTLNGDHQPVINLSWEDAVTYLNWLSSKNKLQPFYVAQGESYVPASPPTNGYRLPTEAEWAYAARDAGTSVKLRFPWGTKFPPHAISGNFADKSAQGLLPQTIKGYNDKYPVSSPVGSFPANNGGFFDMGGNIAEWCNDFYSPYTSSLSNLPDPLGPVSGLHRVVRGSSWRDATIKELRLSYRSYSRNKKNTIGFRIARYQ